MALLVPVVAGIGLMMTTGPTAPNVQSADVVYSQATPAMFAVADIAVPATKITTGASETMENNIGAIAQATTSGHDGNTVVCCIWPTTSAQADDHYAVITTTRADYVQTGNTPAEMMAIYKLPTQASCDQSKTSAQFTKDTRHRGGSIILTLPTPSLS